MAAVGLRDCRIFFAGKGGEIIQVREKIRLEAFREGPDQGMDARCITPDGKCIVMQAKRWANESALRWKELREEKKKSGQDKA